MSQLWLRALAVVVLCALVVSVWRSGLGLDDVTEWLAPHRHSWYALPLVVVAFVALEMLPVALLIAATGIAFGPVLGPAYAMAGCLASASVGFAIGRWLGLRRVQEFGGTRATRITLALQRNGILAVFVLRKIPSPFALANIVAGTSTVRYRDFLVGTVLGMGAFVIAIAGFGPQLIALLHRPSPAALMGAALIVGIPFTLAWVINRALQLPRPV